ncbi:WD40/YVTN/BNR-like repeat-containing protein [Saccharobesus litoralis]|uniref:WD40/YVTN/BNR-like repeat-containing protein n=1 Tax=Saccharobesus litoralis TaxID=2172099 RepID=UPI00131EEB97|nr:YCF48-related protein [Saccharobesus litoralis]
MKKNKLKRNEVIKFVLLITIWLATPWVFAKSAEIQPLASQSLLLDITRVDQTIYAVGERGHIIKAQSTNLNQWQQLTVPINTTLTSIFSLDQNHLWVTGHSAAILHSADAGKTWVVQNYNVADATPLMDIVFIDQLRGIAVGAYGLFLRTQDGGKTWQKELHASLLSKDDIEYLQDIKQEGEEVYQAELAASLPHLNKLTLTSQQVWVVGETGLIAKSVDWGQNWQRQQSLYAGSFFDVQSTKSGVRVAGLRGRVFTLADGDWRAQHTANQVSVNQTINVTNGFIALANSDEISLYAEGKGYSVLGKLTSKSQVAGIILNDTLVTVGELGIQVLPIQTDKRSSF